MGDWIEPKRKSDVVAAYRYDPETERLEVRLQWGEARAYTRVGPVEFKLFQSSPSPGSRLLRVIAPIRKHEDLGRWK